VKAERRRNGKTGGEKERQERMGEGRVNDKQKNER
jgi:hypothetical protein